jgi:hypothetical protein
VAAPPTPGPNLPQVASSKLGAFKPQELSNLAWALAQLQQRPSAEWMQGFMAAARQQHGSFSPQGLTVVLWALAQLDYRPPGDWLDSALAAAKAGAGTYGAQSLATGLWACVALQHHPDASTMELLWERLEARLGECNAADLGMVLWAAATMGQRAEGQPHLRLPPKLLPMLLARCYDLTREFDTRQLATMLWALAKLQVCVRG